MVAISVEMEQAKKFSQKNLQKFNFFAKIEKEKKNSITRHIAVRGALSPVYGVSGFLLLSKICCPLQVWIAGIYQQKD